MAEFDARYKRTTRETKPCPPCPTTCSCSQCKGSQDEFGPGCALAAVGGLVAGGFALAFGGPCLGAFALVALFTLILGAWDGNEQAQMILTVIGLVIAAALGCLVLYALVQWQIEWNKPGYSR